MSILSKTKNGKVYICTKCNNIHIEFGNLNFNFNQKEFNRFSNYILDLDGEHWEKENEKSPFNRKILIPIGHKNFNILLSLSELLEMKELFKFWSEKEKLEYKNIKYLIYKK